MDEAKVNVTYGGCNGELPDPVLFESSDTDIRTWVTEALRTGGIPGIAAQPNADLTDFVIDRFVATEVRPAPYIMIRPKTPFGILT